MITHAVNRSGLFTESMFLPPGVGRYSTRIAIRSPQAHPHWTTPASAPWVKPVLMALDELGDLDSGWDGEGAPTIANETVRSALIFLAGSMQTTTAVPSVVPTPSGGVQLEWHRGGLDIEIEFEPQDQRRLSIRGRPESHDDWSGALNDAGDRFHRLLSRLDTSEPSPWPKELS